MVDGPDVSGPARRAACDRQSSNRRDYVLEAEVIAEYATPHATFSSVAEPRGISRQRVQQIVRRWERETGQSLPRAFERRRLASEAAAELKRRSAPSLAQRLLSRVRPNPATGCWEWVGPVLDTGGGIYPTFAAFGERFAHRVSYRMWVGEIPDGHYVRQGCNGRHCINPFHLYAIAPAEAVRLWTTGRVSKPQTRCKRGHELSGDNVVWNSSSTLRGGVWVKVRTRLCRLCDAERRKRNYRPRPPLPEDEKERAVERSIRRIESARAADRRRVLQREFASAGGEHVDLPAAAGESWETYCGRTDGEGRFGEWLASRVSADPRVQRALSGRKRSRGRRRSPPALAEEISPGTKGGTTPRRQRQTNSAPRTRNPVGRRAARG